MPLAGLQVLNTVEVLDPVESTWPAPETLQPAPPSFNRYFTET